MEVTASPPPLTASVIDLRCEACPHLMTAGIGCVDPSPSAPSHSSRPPSLPPNPGKDEAAEDKVKDLLHVCCLFEFLSNCCLSTVSGRLQFVLPIASSSVRTLCLIIVLLKLSSNSNSICFRQLPQELSVFCLWLVWTHDRATGFDL